MKFNPARIFEFFFATASEANGSEIYQPPLLFNCSERAKVAIVSEAIQPGSKGRVRFQGSWWSAECKQNLILGQGTEVRVVGVRNTTLLVEPITVETCHEQLACNLG